MKCTFELCKRCGRHARIIITRDNGRSEGVHFPSKEHAFYFLHLSMTQRVIIDSDILTAIREEINTSKLPSIYQASEKRLYHIDFVNRHQDKFADFNVEEVCITILGVLEKHIPEKFKEKEIEAFREFSQH